MAGILQSLATYGKGASHLHPTHSPLGSQQGECLVSQEGLLVF